MSASNYTLEIISHLPKFNNKSLRKYYVDGIETVGVWGDEPFEIRFKNNTWQKVQVKITLDGTDILTGKPGDTEVSKDMWVVNGYGTLNLKAWPEDNNGGAGFVFTSANNSVAAHTHGDMSSRGIIAAAVFVEGHVEPIRLTYTPPVYETHHHHHHYTRSKGIGGGYYGSGTAAGGIIGGMVYGTNTGGSLGGTYSSNSISLNDAQPAAASADCYYNEVSDSDSRDLKCSDSLVSVGAGTHVDQKITYVTGLTKPVFTETIRVKYMWWDDLKAKLGTGTHAEAQPSGFPGDHNKKNIDLKNTPRLGQTKGTFRRVEQPQVFDRF